MGGETYQGHDLPDARRDEEDCEHHAGRSGGGSSCDDDCWYFATAGQTLLGASSRCRKKAQASKSRGEKRLDGAEAVAHGRGRKGRGGQEGDAWAKTTFCIGRADGVFRSKCEEAGRLHFSFSLTRPAPTPTPTHTARLPGPCTHHVSSASTLADPGRRSPGTPANRETDSMPGAAMRAVQCPPPSPSWAQPRRRAAALASRPGCCPVLHPTLLCAPTPEA